MPDLLKFLLLLRPYTPNTRLHDLSMQLSREPQLQSSGGCFANPQYTSHDWKNQFTVRPQQDHGDLRPQALLQLKGQCHYRA